MDREEAEALALKQVEEKGIHHKGVSCSVFLLRGESFGDFPVAESDMWLVDFIPADAEGPWVLTIPVKATSKRPKLEKLTTQWFDFYKKEMGYQPELKRIMFTHKNGYLKDGVSDHWLVYLSDERHRNMEPGYAKLICDPQSGQMRFELTM